MESLLERLKILTRIIYLCSSVGQLSSKLIELDSARAGVTARKRWPSAVTSNKGAGISARFTWKRGRRAFTCKDCPVRFNSAFISWLPMLKKKRSPFLSQRTIHAPPWEIWYFPPGPGNGTT